MDNCDNASATAYSILKSTSNRNTLSGMSCDKYYNTENTESLSQLIDVAAQSISTGGRVIYAGSGAAGILAMIDASECVPTFGSGKSQF